MNKLTLSQVLCMSHYVLMSNLFSDKFKSLITKSAVSKVFKTFIINSNFH